MQAWPRGRASAPLWSVYRLRSARARMASEILRLGIKESSCRAPRFKFGCKHFLAPRSKITTRANKVSVLRSEAYLNLEKVVAERHESQNSGEAPSAKRARSMAKARPGAASRSSSAQKTNSGAASPAAGAGGWDTAAAAVVSW